MRRTEAVELILEEGVVGFESQRQLEVLECRRPIFIGHGFGGLPIKIATLGGSPLSDQDTVSLMGGSGFRKLDSQPFFSQELRVVRLASAGVSEYAVGLRDPLRDLSALCLKRFVETSSGIGMEMTRVRVIGLANFCGPCAGLETQDFVVVELIDDLG